MKICLWKSSVLLVFVFMMNGCKGDSNNNAFWVPEKSTLTLNSESLISGPISTTYRGTDSSNPSLTAGVGGSINVWVIKGEGASIEEMFWMAIADGETVNEYPLSDTNNYFFQVYDGDLMNPVLSAV